MAIGLAAGLAVSTSAFANAILEISGPAEVVFDWSRDQCARWDIPDTPARAWRDAQGDVRLVAGSDQSRASAGSDLDRLSRDCAVLYRGAESDDPGAHDDRAWIAAIFTADGKRVEALAHVEYHGHLRPERCPAADYSECWRNSIVQLASQDGGDSFERPGAASLVATLPYAYDGAAGRRSGYFSPSNILRRGDYIYAFVFAERYRAQKRGACLMRRPVTAGAADWRAWDGAGFTVRFADPYHEHVENPEAHVCTPVPGVRSTISSVVHHAVTGQYVAVTPTTRPGPDGAPRSGIYWMTSANLIHWSEPELLLELPLLWRRDCAAPAAFAYPSLIDPDSPSAAFDSVDDHFWLYYTEMPLLEGCRIGPRRNLLRRPLSLRPA